MATGTRSLDYGSNRVGNLRRCTLSGGALNKGAEAETGMARKTTPEQSLLDGLGVFGFGVLWFWGFGVLGLGLWGLGEKRVKQFGDSKHTTFLCLLFVLLLLILLPQLLL